MSIISCPGCANRISSKLMLCPHCGFKRGNFAEGELKEFRRRELRDHIYHLKMASYSVLTLFVVAFAWYWMDTEGFQHPASMGPYLLLAIAAIAYLAIRLYLFKAKRNWRRLNAQACNDNWP